MKHNLQTLRQQLAKRWALLLMLFLGQSLASSAEVRLFMENFNISSGETKEVALMLTNDQDAFGVSANIQLPVGLTYVDNSVAMTDRVEGRGADVQASTNTGQLAIILTDCEIAAGEGAIITFQVTATGALEDGENTITVSDIAVSDETGDSSIETVTETTATVTALPMPYCEFGCTVETVSLAIGEEYQIDITLDNEGATNLAAFSGKLTMSPGLELVPASAKEKFIYANDRTPAPLAFKYQQFDGYMTFVLSSTRNAVIQGTSGVIFSFKVKATVDMAETGTIVLSDLNVANTVGKTQQCNDVTINVTNMAYGWWTTIQQNLEELGDELDAAIAAAGESPAESVQAAINAAQDALATLTQNLTDKHEAGTLTEDDLQEFEATATVPTAIVAVYTAINDAKKAELMTVIAGFELSLNGIAINAEEVLPEAYTELTNTKAGILAKINNLRTWVNAQTNLTAESTLLENTVEADIQALAAAVETAKAAKIAKDVNDAKQVELIAEIDALKEALEAIVISDEEVLPADFASLTAKKEEIQDAIEALETSVNEQAEAIALTAESVLPENTVAVDIQTLADDLEAAKAAKIAKDVNDAKQVELIAEIDALLEALDAIVIDDTEVLPADFATLTAQKEAIQEAIDGLTAWVNEQAEATALTAESVLPENSVAYNTDALAIALQEAKAAKIAKDVNDAKKEELIAQIEQLKAPLDAIEINEADVLADDFTRLTEAKDAIQSAIDELTDWVNEQAEAIALTAESVLPENTVAVDIQTLADDLEDAKAAKIAKDVNDAKKEELMAQITEMQEALDAIEIVESEVLADDYATLTETQTTIQEAIDELTAWVTEQAEATALTAESELPDNNVVEATENLATALQEAKEAKEAADQLAADKAAFNAYKAEQVAAVEALAEDGDSEACQTIIANAKAAIEALTYDEEKSLEENKAVVDGIVAPVAGALADQRAAEQLAADKAAFDAYKAEQVAAVEALAEDGDSEACQTIIANAKAAIEALTYDEEKSLEENKALVDGIVASAADNLADQRAAEQLIVNKHEFAEYQSEKIAAALAMAEDGDSEAAQEIINGVVSAIGMMAYDESKTLEENKAAVDEIFDPLAEALAAQREADRIAANEDAYAALSEELDDLEAAIQEARETIEAEAPDVKDDYLAQLDELLAQVTAAREALEAAYAAQELTAESVNENIPTQEEIDAIVNDAEEAQSNYVVPGDFTGDGVLDDEDVDTFIDLLLGNGDVDFDYLNENPDDPAFDMYDLNNDGVIDIADAQACLNLSIGLNWDGSVPSNARSAEVETTSGTISAQAVQMANGITRYTISLAGDLNYSAFQMDVKMSEGVKVVNEQLTETGMTLKSSTRSNGTHRILGFTGMGELTANGKMLVIDVQGNGTVSFGNIRFATASAKSVSLTMGGEATGISTFEAGQQNATVYDLNGRTQKVMKKGMNIVREADGNVRKVLVK